MRYRGGEREKGRRRKHVQLNWCEWEKSLFIHYFTPGAMLVAVCLFMDTMN